MNKRFVVWSMSCALGLWACGGSSGDTPPQVAPVSQTPTRAAAPNESTASSELSGGSVGDGGVGAASADGHGANQAVPAASSTATAPALPPATAFAADPAAPPVPESKAGKTKAGGSTGTGAAAGKAPKTAANAGAPPSTGALGSASVAGPRVFECGDKGQKPCPAQGWMKTNMAPAAASGDTAELAKQFDYVAGHAPPGFANWAAIAKGGSAKAKAGDVDGAKAACKTCHDQYKAKYKAELRDRPF